MFSHFSLLFSNQNYRPEYHGNSKSSNILKMLLPLKNYFFLASVKCQAVLNAENREVDNRSKTFCLPKANILRKGSRQYKVSNIIGIR